MNQLDTDNLSEDEHVTQNVGNNWLNHQNETFVHNKSPSTFGFSHMAVHMFYILFWEAKVVTQCRVL